MDVLLRGECILEECIYPKELFIFYFFTFFFFLLLASNFKAKGLQIFETFSHSTVNDHVSEYEQMECMTRCAAVTISFPILTITHMHKHSWQCSSGISPAWNPHLPMLF